MNIKKKHIQIIIKDVNKNSCADLDVAVFILT